MARDDSMLYSGATSETFVSPKQKELARKRKEQKLELRDKRVVLNPAITMIAEVFATEEARLHSIDSLSDEKLFSSEDFRIEMLARKKTLEHLVSIKMKLIQTMKSKPVEEDHGRRKQSDK